MTWRVVAASAVGTSHLEKGEACQDSCWAEVENIPGHPPTLSIFVADGAGSALCGGDGSDLAIEAAVEFIETKTRQHSLELSNDLAVECVVAVRDRIFADAEKQGSSVRDYACTFLGVVSCAQGTLVMQVGDGGIVVDVGQGLEVPVVPMSGEYANMTSFVTDDNALDVLISKTFSARASRVAAFSDGIQRLALNMATNTAHEPFFAPLFEVLATAASVHEDELQCALINFLNSASVNGRTDDDKTLALAILVA